LRPFHAGFNPATITHSPQTTLLSLQNVLQKAPLAIEIHLKKHQAEHQAHHLDTIIE
jgi:hypothetical protein